MPTNNLIRQLPMAGRANFLPYQIGASGKPELALPGILAGAVNAVTAPYRAMNPQQYPDFNTEQEAADFALNMMGGGTVFGRAPKNALGMNVWHGSPHKLEPTPDNPLGEFRVSADVMGTGEGAQAYGVGNYQAEARATGEGYRDNLSSIASPGDDAGAAYAYVQKFGNDEEYAKDILAQQIEAMRANASPNLKTAEGMLASINSGTYKAHVPNSGYLYESDLPDSEIAKMLDWDNQVSEKQRKLLAADPPKSKVEIKNDPENGGYTVYVNGRYYSSTYDLVEAKKDARYQKRLRSEKKLFGDYSDSGEEIYRRLEETLGPEKASQTLREAGIPGIRYLDGGSRSMGSGTSNFVVFDPKASGSKILSRNGMTAEQALAEQQAQAIARYREVKGPKSVVRMEAALRTAGVPLPKNEPVAYIQRLVDQAHRRN